MIRRVYIPPIDPPAIWTADSIGSAFLSVVSILLSFAAIYAVGAATFIEWSI